MKYEYAIRSIVCTASCHPVMQVIQVIQLIQLIQLINFFQHRLLTDWLTDRQHQYQQVCFADKNWEDKGRHIAFASFLNLFIALFVHVIADGRAEIN